MPRHSHCSPSLHRGALLLTIAALLAVPAGAQHGPVAVAAPLDTTPPAEAHQFDFLLGDWSLVGHPHVSALVAMVHGSPKIVGTWKAWRSVEGFGIEDEMRLTDDDGNPRLFSHCLRIYDRGARRWSASMVDVYRTHFQPSTAEWKGNQMVAISQTTGEDGKPMVSRSRFFDIKPNSFHWQQDHSYDGGRTWEEATLVIDAKRVAAVAPR